MGGRISATSGSDPTNGICDATNSIHNGLCATYDISVRRSVRDIIMSTGNTTLQDTYAEFARRNSRVDEAADVERHAIENVEVASLQIDDSYDVDCDPYNCTGQLLVDAKKLSM